MDEAYLNQLRSRLDPSFHSQPLPDQRDLAVTPPIHDEEEEALHNNDLERATPAEDSTVGTDTAAVGGKKQRKKKRKVKKKEPEEEEVEGELSMEGEAASTHPSEGISAQLMILLLMYSMHRPWCWQQWSHARSSSIT